MMDWSSLSIPPLSITNYSPDAWHNWFNKFKLITKATTFSSLGDPQKVAVLLMKLGSEITPIFDEFGVDVDDISYDDLVRRFTLYFQPLKARNVLLNLKQKSGESFEQFAERLTVHSYPCVFGPGTFRENYLCDVFLNNIEDRYCHVRSKILESYPYLEFRKVVEIANKLFLEECGFNRSAAHNGFPSFPGTHEDSKLCNFDSQVFQGAGQGNHRSQNQGANRGPRAYPSVPSFRLNPIHHDDIVDVQILTKHTDITYVSPVSYEETRKAFFKFFNEKQRKNPIKVELGKRYAVQFDEKWYRVDVASIQPSNTASVQSVDFGWRKHFPLSELHNLELDCISQKPMSLMVTFENTNKNPKEGERVTLKFLSNENGLWTVRLLENDLNKKYKQNQGGNRNKFGPDEQKPKRDELDSDILQSQTETSSTSSNNTKTGQDLKGKGSHYNKREQVTGNRNVFVPDEQKPKMREQNDRREQKSNMSVDHVNKETSTGRTGNKNQNDRRGQNYQADSRDDFNSNRHQSKTNRNSGGNRNSNQETKMTGQDSDGFKHYGGEKKQNNKTTIPDGGLKDDGNSRRTSGGNKGEHAGNERGSGFNNQRSGGGKDHGGDYKVPDGDFRNDGGSQRTSGGNRGENSGRERGGGFNNRRSGGGRDNGSDSKVPDNYFRDNGNSQRTSGGNQGEHKGSERGGGNNRRSGGMRDDVAITQMAVGNNPIPGIADIQIDDLPIPKDRFTKVTFLNQVGPVAYVYPKSCDKEFQNMMEHLGKISEDPSLCRVLRDPKKGMFCAAPYDGDLYRAKILGVKEKSVKVLFFDFGNEEIVPRDSLVVLPDSLSDSQWSFRIKAPESFNVDDLLSGDVIEVRPKFMDSEGVCVVDVDGYNSDLAVQAPSVVNASRSSTDTPRSPHVDDTGRGDKSKSPRQTLREAEPVRSDSSKSRKMAQPVDDAPVRTPRPPIPKNTFSEVQVAYVGAEGCFVIALADLEILREIHQDINAEPLTACSTLAINQVCAAPFEGDIFRAKILSINRIESLCSVEFIDFGNITEIHTDDLLELPARLTKGVYAFKIKFDCDRVLEVNESISISPITLESDGAWLVQLEGEPLTADYQLPSESGGSIDERDDFIEFSRNANKNPNRRNQR
uniref:Maternal protein tudor n=1 Tax=Lygus hesperus TaxID=30085 RepID=A0A146KQB8_LYGHE